MEKGVGFEDTMVLLVGPNQDSHLTTRNSREIGEIRGAEDPVVLYDVGQLTAHDHKMHLALGLYSAGLKEAQPNFAGPLVVLSVWPGIVAEKVVDFGNP